MKTIAFLNKKGGVGKTSSCHHLAGALARLNQRVLLVDTDPQANLTQGLLGPAVTRALPADRTIASLFDDIGGPPVEELLLPAAKVPGVVILPGSETMDDLNVTRPAETGPLQFAIRDALAPLALRFDVCLIDCPPNLNLSSWAALAAADGVVVPVQAEDYGAQGLVAVRKALRRVQAEVNPSLVLIGYLITLFNKTLAVHLSYEADLRQIHGADVFESVFPLAKDFKEAIPQGLPVGLYKPRSAAAQAVAAIADELLERAARRLAGRRVA